MSNVLKALEKSEHGYQMSTFKPLASSPQQVNSARSNMVWIGVIALPALVVAAWQGVSTWQHAIKVQQALSEQPAPVVEQPIEYQIRPAPNFGQLQPVMSASDEVSEPEVAAAEVVKTSTKAQPSGAEDAAKPKSSIEELSDKEQGMLEGVDLSALPPDLARKVHSALNQDDSSLESSSNSLERRDWINLAKHADELEGRLPAMNFQTHVYSNNEKKRWVKVNGTEYKPGEEIAAGVKLVEIRAKGSLIRFRDEMIFVPALYDWKG